MPASDEVGQISLKLHLHWGSNQHDWPAQETQHSKKVSGMPCGLSKAAIWLFICHIFHRTGRKGHPFVAPRWEEIDGYKMPKRTFPLQETSTPSISRPIDCPLITMASLNFTQDSPVTLVVGTSHWNVTPESEAFQHEVLAVMKQYNVTHLDTARAYVRNLPYKHLDL